MTCCGQMDAILIIPYISPCSVTQDLVILLILLCLVHGTLLHVAIFVRHMHIYTQKAKMCTLY